MMSGERSSKQVDCTPLFVATVLQYITIHKLNFTCSFMLTAPFLTRASELHSYL